MVAGRARRILLVDDEDLARSRLQRFVQERGEGHQIEVAENGMVALEKIARFAPEIVFLDVKMPGLSGFDVLYQLPERNFHLVFQTAYDQFAVRAFDHNACDYLLKPIEQDRFNRAMDRVLARDPNPRELDRLESVILAEQRYLETILVKSGRYSQLIQLRDVNVLMKVDFYTALRTVDGQEFLTRHSLRHLLERLSPEEFVQIHRHTVVRLAAITGFKSGEPLKVILQNDVSLPVSRGKRKVLLELLQKRGSV